MKKARKAKLIEKYIEQESYAGRRDGENYAQTKARLKQTRSLYEALLVKPAAEWDLTDEEVIKAFTPTPVENHIGPNYMGTSDHERLATLVKQSGLSFELVKQHMKEYSPPSRHLEECAKNSGLGDINLARAAAETVVKTLIGLNTWTLESVYHVRAAFPELASDEFIKKFINFDELVSVRLEERDYHDKRLIPGRRRLAAFLPGWKEIDAISKVMTSLDKNTKADLTRR